MADLRNEARTSLTGPESLAAAAFADVRGLAPRRRDYAGLRSSWKGDVIAGLTVGVVALPLALAFGITTGLGADAGLITAIVAGLVAAVFGGSNVQVSGPTGAMTVVLVPIVARYGAHAVFVVSMIAGVFLVVAAIARLGRYIAFIPWPVVEGFTVGIAVIIFLQQVPPALGVGKPKGDNTAAVAVKAVFRLLRQRQRAGDWTRCARRRGHCRRAPRAPVASCISHRSRSRDDRRQGGVARRCPHRIAAIVSAVAVAARTRRSRRSRT